MKLVVSAALAVAMVSTSTHAATISGSFTDLQGESVLWSATVDAGITLSQQICCTLPSNQGDGTIKDFVNTAFGTSFTGNVGKQDGFADGTFSVDWTGLSAELFAIHTGGKGGGNELLILLSDNSSVFDFSFTGAKGGLSSIQGFAGPEDPSGGGGPAVATPLPAALPLFASGGALLGFLGWRRKRKSAA